MDSCTATAPFDQHLEEEDESDDDEWELCNDGGFVYKRKKRRLDPSVLAQPSPCTDADLEAQQEQSRRERKKKTLFKLKAKYRKEFDLWNSLSNTLSAMEAKASQLLQERYRELEKATSLPPSSMAISKIEPVGESLLNELVLQVDTQEAVIRDVSDLCDVTEAVCYKEDEHFRLSLFDLPIWGSPRELLAALCDDK